MLEDNLKLNAESIASEQQQLGQSMKEIDSQLASIMSALTDRQKQYARYAEKLSRVHEISHSLSRCQKALATALDSIETLNNQLPAGERLEHFQNTTLCLVIFSRKINSFRSHVSPDLIPTFVPYPGTLS